jgi:dihydropteroate synthase
VAAQEELRRVLPVIRGLRRRSFPVSIDTTKSEVAEQAVQAGATIINDISGLRFDPRLAEVARRHCTPLVLMHIRGRPQTMQRKAFAKSIWRSLGRGLEWSIRQALASGVRRSQLILDPGLGFGKTRRQNFEILSGLKRMQRFGLPVLIGASRKSFVQAVARGEGLEPRRRPSGARSQLSTTAWPLTTQPAAPSARASGPPSPWQDHTGYGLPPASRACLPLLTKPSALVSRTGPSLLAVGDAAMVTAAILGGAHIVRVHDPASVLPAVRIADALLAGL